LIHFYKRTRNVRGEAIDGGESNSEEGRCCVRLNQIKKDLLM